MVGYLGCHVWTWLCSFSGESQNCIAPWSRFLVGRITDSPQNDPWEENNRRTWLGLELAFINVLGDGGFLISRRRDIITNDHRMWLTAADKGIKILMGCRGCQKKVLPRLQLMVDFQSIVFVYFTVDYYSSQQTSFRIFDVRWLR